MEYILIGINVAHLLYFLAPPSIECLQCCDQVPASLVFTDTTLYRDHRIIIHSTTQIQWGGEDDKNTKKKK